MHPETPEKAPEIEVFKDIKQARQALASLWHEDVDPVEFQKKLERQWQEHQDALIDHGYEMTAAFRLTQKMRPDNRERRDIHNLRVVSGSPAKQAVVKEALADKDIAVAGVDIDDLDEQEQKDHQWLRRMINEYEEETREGRPSSFLSPKTPYFYTIDIAENKARAAGKVHPQDAIFSGDVAVLHSVDILEKPKDIKEAKEMLAKISGQEISVSSGAVLVATISSGREIIIRKGAVMHIELQAFSEEDIDQYLSANKDWQSVAGVVDYAHPAAQRLIAQKPIKVEGLKISGRGNYAEAIYIDPTLLTSMRDYCVGMPKEMIQEMVGQIEKL